MGGGPLHPLTNNIVTYSGYPSWFIGLMFIISFEIIMCTHIFNLIMSITMHTPHRKIHCESSKKWLNILQAKKVPVLVCLTHADKLYAEYMTDDGQHPDETFMKEQLPQQLRVSYYLYTVKPPIVARYYIYACTHARTHTHTHAHTHTQGYPHHITINKDKYPHRHTHESSYEQDLASTNEYLYPGKS